MRAIGVAADCGQCVVGGECQFLGRCDTFPSSRRHTTLQHLVSLRKVGYAVNSHSSRFAFGAKRERIVVAGMGLLGSGFATRINRVNIHEMGAI